MKRYLAMALAAGMFLLAGPAGASDAVYYPPRVTGKKVRRQVRHFLYPRNLRADKKRIYDKYGFTPYRLRINAYGEVRERWRYLDQGLEFMFDAAGTLLSRREIRVEKRRSGIYH